MQEEVSYVLDNIELAKLIFGHIRKYRDLHVAGRVNRLFRVVVAGMDVYRYHPVIQRHMYIYGKFPFTGVCAYYIPHDYTDKMIDFIIEMDPETAISSPETMKWAVTNSNIKYITMCVDKKPENLCGEYYIQHNDRMFEIFKFIIDELIKMSQQMPSNKIRHQIKRVIIQCSRHVDCMNYIFDKELVPRHVENAIKTLPPHNIISAEQFVRNLGVGEVETCELVSLINTLHCYEIFGWLIKLDKVDPEDIYREICEAMSEHLL